MNAYEFAVQNNITGTDAEEIVAALRATGVTQSRIALADLLFLLNNRGMLVRLIRPADTGEKWAGSVVNMVLAINAGGTAQQAAAVNQWFSHITNDRNNFFDTTVPAFSAPFWELSQSMADLSGMPSAEDFAAVAGLGGGWRFAELTVQQFAADREQYQQQQAARQALAALQQRRQKWDQVSADIRSRIESGALADDAAVVAAVQAAL